MRRPPASIVILAWNAWDSTQACLDSLRTTLGPRDQVVVVDNGSTDQTPRALRRYPWVEVVTNAENRGFAGGCNDGAAAARHDLLVFLNNDTLLAGRWLDALLAPLGQDSTVVAAGPRSNFVSGPQVVEGASYAGLPGLRRFARTWADDHRGQTSDVDRLVGFCLAVRRDDFFGVGGFDEAYGTGGFEDDDLCRRLAASGRRLVVCHDSFVHHDGHRSFDANGLDWFAEQERNRTRFEARAGSAEARLAFPLVSACLITRDEEANLEACLSSLGHLADQVVVYDTGSVDGTVALARRLGAEVIEGYWDDDFARARNSALERCRGDWVAWLDADETLVCDDVEVLRHQLATADPAVDAWSVAIDNLTGAGVGAGFVHYAARLFRRARCEWNGRLHEQVARRGDHGPIAQATLETARIRHTGYLDSAMRQRDKVERNLRVARAEVAEMATEGSRSFRHGFALVSLARSCMTAGRYDEALQRAAEALDVTDQPVTRRMAMRTAAESLLGAGRPEEALAWVDRLRDASRDPVQADLTEARVRLAMGQPEVALELFERVGDSHSDEDGFEHSAGQFAPLRSEALAALGRPGEAADVLLGCLDAKGILDTHLGTLVGYLQEAGRPLGDLASAMPADHAPMFFAQVLQLDPGLADQVLEACLDASPDPMTPLATAASLAPRLDISRALVWSDRLRRAGQASACPLMAKATRAPDALERARSAAVALRAFGDPQARNAFAAAMSAADAAQHRIMQNELPVLCPELVPLLQPDLEVDGGGHQSGVTPRVSVVIPCFNKAELTLACLQALEAGTPKALYEVVLVDNGSTDATVRLADVTGPRFRVLRNEENLGFARACNQGAAAAAGEVLVFLNNDTAAHPGWLPALLAGFEDPSVGIVGARLLYPDGRVQHAGVGLREDPATGLVDGYHLGSGLEGCDPAVLQEREVAAVTGAALAVRRPVFEAVGGFDEGYWNGNEDLELCLAARRAGWRVRYQPEAVLTHHESASGPARWAKTPQNRRRFTERWADTLATGKVPGARLDPPTPSSDRAGGANVVGFFEAELGLGQSARLVVDALEAAGVPCSTVSYDKHWNRANHRFEHRTGPAYDVNVICLNADVMPAFVLERGASFFTRRYTVAMWHWELENLPPVWRRATALAHEFWVGSEFTRRALAAATPKPVVTLPLPVPRHDGPPPLSRSQVGLPEGFVFGFMFDYNSVRARKNPDGLIEAFKRAFRPGEGPRLVIKTINAFRAPADAAALEALAEGRDDIVIYDAYLDAESTQAWTGLVDAYVSLHRSEGFGLTLAEAMAWGTPVVATGYSGNLDYMTSDNSYLVGHRPGRVPDGAPPYPAGYRWAEPDLDQAAEALRAIYADPGAARARGLRGQADIRVSHGPDRAAAAVKQRFEVIATEMTTFRPRTVRPGAPGGAPHPQPVKLNIGAGGDRRPGYYHVDLRRDVADVVASADALPFRTGSADAVLASDILEHFPASATAGLLSEWRRVLGPEATLTVRVPNLALLAQILLHGSIDPRDIIRNIYGGHRWGPGGSWDAHHTGWTPPLLHAELARNGFDVLSDDGEPNNTVVARPTAGWAPAAGTTGSGEERIGPGEESAPASMAKSA